MVMRKFKKSIDNGTGEGSENPEIGLNSPRLTRRNRGGSFSGMYLHPIFAKFGIIYVPRRKDIVLNS